MLTEFVLVGLSDHPKLQKVLFVLVLCMYLMILLGNGVLISVVIYDVRLHTRATECVLLGTMALDRFLAICYPLRYPVIMSKGTYVPMAAGCWVAGLVDSLVQTSLAVHLPFCSNNVIHHFECEILAILKLACGDISINVISMAGSNLLYLAVPLIVIAISYIFIVTTILRIPSSEGKQKAFSTCSSHLTVVIIFYGSIFFMYAKPKSKTTAGEDKIISLFYGVVTPMLNPIIYSLRNKDVKAAVKYILKQKYIQ
ncbi:Olfactory receptor 13C8 [Lemmus lemmus]